MASGLLSFILLQVFLLSNAQYYLTVNPKDIVVSIGGSIQLNCSINCPSGIVVWKGLDSADNGQYIAPGYSVQTLENISISMEGTKICSGSCPGHRNGLQNSVKLGVYALPETLHLRKNIKNGIHYLNCSIERVYPPPDISCYRGSEKLDETTDIDEVQDEDDLYNVMWSWAIPEEDWLSETPYRCEAQVKVNDQVLTREGTLKISNKEESTTAAPASTTSQSTSTLSLKETSYLVTTITAFPGAQEGTTIRSHQSTSPAEYTQTTVMDTVITQSTTPTQATSKPIFIEESTTAVPDSSTSQSTSTLSLKETSYLVTTITAIPGAQEGTTIRSHQSTRPGVYTQTTVMDTVITQSTPPKQTPNKPINIDGIYLMWTMVPATCLVGSFLLTMLIYRQLSKKGFFQPNHMAYPTDKKNVKSQGSLQAVFCYDNTNNKEFSLY